MHHIWLTMGLLACRDGAGLSPQAQSASGTPDAAIQVEVVSALPLPAGTRFDVWASRGQAEPQSGARLAADDAVLLRVEPGTWEVWATTSVTLREDSGVPLEALQCAGRADGVKVSGRGTTVLRLETTCQRVALSASAR